MKKRHIANYIADSKYICVSQP